MPNPSPTGLRNRRILYAVSVAGIQRLLQVAGTIITIPLILHALGTDGFGLWSAATSLTWLGFVLDLGLGSALITLVAQGITEKNTSLIRDQVTAGIAGAILMAGLVLLAGSALVCLTFTGTERIAFLIAVLALAINIPLSIANNIWMGLQKGYVAGAWDIVQIVFSISGLLWAVFTGAGTVMMVTAFYGGILLASILSFVHLMLTHSQIRPIRITLPASVWRQVLSKGVLFSALSIAGGMGYALDNVLALKLLGPAASAQMAIILRIGINAIGIISVLTQPLWPAFTDAHGRSDHRWAQRTLVLGTAGIAALGILGGAALGLWGQDVLHWWLHHDLEISTPLFWTTAFWIFILSVPRIAVLLFNAISVLRFQLVVCLAANAIALALKYFYAPQFGVTGIFLATPVCWLVILWPSYIVRLCTWWRSGKKNA